MRARKLTCLCLASTFLAGCAIKPILPSDKHLARQTAADDIPQPIRHRIVLPAPVPAARLETYSIVVSNVPAQEILFNLSRDAKINLDIHPGIQGSVTLNALNQTLPQILARIARQIDMRYELENGNLIVLPDTPYLHNYRIDYVNMTRDMEGAMATATQVGSGTASIAGNNSSLGIKNNSKNHFWDTLIQNIKDVLHETDKILPEGSSETIVQQAGAASSTGTGAQPPNNKKNYNKGGIENSPNPVSIQEGGTTVTRLNTFREAAAVIANPENGIITVRATGKQHEKIQEFIDQVMTNARRQVLIEATLVEVTLSDAYKQGINWELLRGAVNLSQAGTSGLASNNTENMFTFSQNGTINSHSKPFINIAMLESFGKVKVISSPKLSVMNNQTAILRVVDNLVYFTVSVQKTPGTTVTAENTITTTTVNTTPVGFTMSVTPQISDSDTVLLNLRPSITRLVGYVNDPNPDLVKKDGTPIINAIPQIQIREIESVLKIENNQIAVMGGLMQDEVRNLSDGIPGVSDLKYAGELFKNHNDSTTKTELVIFLRPVILRDASINGDFKAYSAKLPDQHFFKDPRQ
jgi:MSHA biogenesis protein MshL